MATATTEQQMLRMAKAILDLNPDACLSGTLMIKIRNIKFHRKADDIDILVNSYATELKFPKAWGEMKEFDVASDGTGARYSYKGIKIDVMSSSEEHEVVNGFRCGSFEKLLKAKFEYAKQDNSSAFKHYTDLVELDYVFPEKTTFEDLPF